MPYVCSGVRPHSPFVSATFLFLFGFFFATKKKSQRTHLPENNTRKKNPNIQTSCVIIQRGAQITIKWIEMQATSMKWIFYFFSLYHCSSCCFPFISVYWLCRFSNSNFCEYKQSTEYTTHIPRLKNYPAVTRVIYRGC